MQDLSRRLPTRPSRVKTPNLADRVPIVQRSGQPTATAPDCDDLTVVSSGVDTLEIIILGRLKTAFRHRLAKLREEHPGEPIELADGVSAVMSAHGRQPVYSAVASSPHTVDVAWAFGDGVEQAAHVTFRSAMLWSVGFEACLRLAFAWAREWCAAGYGRRVKVRRVDVCVDVTGWQPPHTMSGQWVTRARKWRTHGGADEDANGWTDHCIGRRWTGLEIGRMSTGVQLAAYDKTRELQAGPKRELLHALWRKRGWQGQTVWRIEARVTGRALASMIVGDTSCASPSQLLDGGYAACWRYVLQWASLRQPNSDSNPSRWPVAPIWSALRESFGAGDGERAPAHLKRRWKDHPDECPPVSADAVEAYVRRVERDAADAARGAIERVAGLYGTDSLVDVPRLVSACAESARARVAAAVAWSLTSWATAIRDAADEA